ncbi:Oidioi.mRNA.OKI2018_I69.PAR.g13160.t1.cds [Oikopleura dioica]|uniref:Oidioi.mRNA.OKI2018_I69.PAR.g13160.t1.cds n=1 Tax=Oikopleura dioica TaxID=34765 RepID=A0ABN7S7X4_OIKDI|nr:Oidioi.mRNA.OKI2018_I69.PAR.g13160.t1.cds [Oikopleura dioica]
MSYDEAMSTIQDWIEMTGQVLADHERAGKFQIRTDKLLRNALRSYDANCTIPYDAHLIGKNDFAVWEKQAVRSEDHCIQVSTARAGLKAWVDNYACMSKKTSRQTKRVTKFIGKIANPYC